MNDKPQEVKERFKSGATRNSIGPYAWHLLSPHGLRELAAVMKEGEVSHGSRNWEKGMPRDVVINHMLNHLMKYMEGDRSERHIGKVMAGAMFIAHYDALDMECPNE